jgi:hypothetical protein
MMSPLHGKQQVIQLLKSHANKFIKDNILGWDKKLEVNYINVNSYVNDVAKDDKLRKGLMRSWNRGSQPYKITQPADLVVSGVEKISGGKRLERSDSFDLQDMDYEAELKDQMAKKKIIIETKDGNKKAIPLFESAPQTTKLVRGYGRAFAEKGKITGPQFGLKIGSNFGLFDAPQGNDVVYVPLEQNKNGNYFRDGNIFDWSSHGKNLKKSVGDKGKFKEELSKTLEGDVAPNSKEVLSTAGAMMCDSKTSIRGYQSCLEEFKESKENDPTKLFSSDPKAKPKWEPSVKGGRKLPSERKLELVETYKKEIAAQPLLFQNNCLINAICFAVHGRIANVDELVSIRLETDTLGEMLAASPRIVNSIRRILNIPNPIEILYPNASGTPSENHPGTGVQVTVYHEGVNHFTNTKPKGKKYSK